jgi:hypothetical protein
MVSCVGERDQCRRRRIASSTLRSDGAFPLYHQLELRGELEEVAAHQSGRNTVATRRALIGVRFSAARLGFTGNHEERAPRSGSGCRPLNRRVTAAAPEPRACSSWSAAETAHRVMDLAPTHSGLSMGAALRRVATNPGRCSDRARRPRRILSLRRSMFRSHARGVLNGRSCRLVGG